MKGLKRPSLARTAASVGGAPGREHRRGGRRADLDPAGLQPGRRGSRASEVASLASRVACWLGNSATSTSWAAVATAAACGVALIGRGRRAQVRLVASLDRVHRVVDGALNHRQVEVGDGRALIGGADDRCLGVLVPLNHNIRRLGRRLGRDRARPLRLRHRSAVCAITVCAPSAITPAAAAPITIANRLPISCFLFVLALISGLLRVVASDLPTSRGSGACLTARSLRHGGTHSVHTGRARRGLGVRRREPSARGAPPSAISSIAPRQHDVFARRCWHSEPGTAPKKRGAWDLPRRHALRSFSPSWLYRRNRYLPRDSRQAVDTRDLLIAVPKREVIFVLWADRSSRHRRSASSPPPAR